MVYESDFYTTRRPYRTTPSLSTYTVSSVPSRQVRILPGLGKVHVVHTYDRIVPYVGHKRLTVVTSPPIVVRVRPSTLYREYDRIEKKLRPITYYSPTSSYLNSEPITSYKMVYVRNPYTGVNYYTTYRPYSVPSLRNYHYYYKRSPYTGNYYLNFFDDYYPYYPYYGSTRLTYEKSPVTGNYFLTYNPLYYPTYYNYPYYYYYPYWRRPVYEKSSITGDYYINYLPPLKYERAFDDEARFIKAQTQSLIKRVHTPVPRIERSWTPITTMVRYDDTPARWSSDNYIYRMLVTHPQNPKISYTAYFTEPVRKYIGQGHLAAVHYIGDKGFPRRSNLRVYDDPVKNDIQLLSYYINRFREQKMFQEPTSKVPLDPNRPSRHFSVHRPLEDPTTKELQELRDAREQRLKRIYDDSVPAKGVQEDPVKIAQKKKEEARALAEEQAKKAAQAKKEEAARRAELARQEELAAQAAAERAAELERKAEEARQAEAAKQAELERIRREEEERARQEEERKAAEAAKAEEERQQLLRLEEIARQAEAEKEAELARQAEELAELARQEAELAEKARLEEERLEQERKEAEAAELARKEAELAELEKKEKEAAEAARIEAELAAKAREEAELAELLRQQAELDALEAEAKAMLEPVQEPTSQPEGDFDWPAEDEFKPRKKSTPAEEWAAEEAAAAEEPAPAETDIPVEETPAKLVVTASAEPAEPEPVVEEPATPETQETLEAPAAQIRSPSEEPWP